VTNEGDHPVDTNWLEDMNSLRRNAILVQKGVGIKDQVWTTDWVFRLLYIELANQGPALPRKNLMKLSH